MNGGDINPIIFGLRFVPEFYKGKYGIDSIRYKSLYAKADGSDGDYELLYPFLKEQNLSYYDARKLAIYQIIYLKKFKNRFYFRLNQCVDRDRIKEYL